MSLLTVDAVEKQGPLAHFIAKPPKSKKEAWALRCLASPGFGLVPGISPSSIDSQPVEKASPTAQVMPCTVSIYQPELKAAFPETGSNSVDSRVPSGWPLLRVSNFHPFHATKKGVYP